MIETLEELARDCAHLTAQIPRERELPPQRLRDPYKVRMKEVGKRVIDAETTLKGVEARLKLVELQLAKLLAEKKTEAALTAWTDRLENRMNDLEALMRELAQGHRNIANSIRQIHLCLPASQQKRLGVVKELP